MKLADKISLLTSETKQMLQRLREQAQIQHPQQPVMDLFKAVHESSPVFVLSTGRAGTQFITSLLAQSTLVKAHHEPAPTLNWYNRVAWEGEASKSYLQGAFEGARYELIRDAYILKKQYIETNNRLTFLAPVIAQLYPNARFVHLVRKPEAFVKSGLQRGWYQNTNIHDEGRIVKKDGWEKMDEVQRIAWLWAETNRFIYDFMLTVPAEQKLFIASENLYSNTDIALQLANFFGATDVARHSLEKLMRRPVNKSRKKPITLTPTQLAQVQEIAVPVINVLGL